MYTLRVAYVYTCVTTAQIKIEDISITSLSHKCPPYSTSTHYYAFYQHTLVAFLELHINLTLVIFFTQGFFFFNICPCAYIQDFIIAFYKYTSLSIPLFMGIWLISSLALICQNCLGHFHTFLWTNILIFLAYIPEWNCNHRVANVY